MIEAHLFAKELVSINTAAQTEARYQFLLNHRNDVVGNVQQKGITRFLGISPQGFSRFLRQRKSKLD